MNQVVEAKTTIGFTGNPFVDTGLAVIAALAEVEDVRGLTIHAIREIHGDGTRLSYWNGLLKSFTMVFTSNSMLTNPSVKDRNKRADAYKAILSRMLNEIGSETIPYRCEACGAEASEDLDLLCRKALHGIAAKEQRRFIGRDWFPLSGSLGSDAQALPAASRAPRLCAKCLFAVHYLPLGLILLDGRLAVFQSTSIEFWYELVKDIVHEVRARIQGGNYDILGRKEGSGAVARRLLGLFERIQAAGKLGDIPPGTTLQAWRFTNSGASPECTIEEIPNPALVFLWKAVRQGLRHEVESLIRNEGKTERPFLRCITDGRDYNALYPRGRRPGASTSLFYLYQTEVCGRSSRSMGLAWTLARQAAEDLKPKDLERFQREEAFGERAVRNWFRDLMARLAQEGKLCLNDYLALFPLDDEKCGISVRFDGWRIIRYYLHNSRFPQPSMDGATTAPVSSPPKVASVRYYAARILTEYIRERGRDGLQREVLNRAARGDMGVSWLRQEFASLSEKYRGFTYGGWEDLCKNDKGELFVSELLFQMRLLWGEWMRGSELPTAEVPILGDASGLPAQVEGYLAEIFSRYVEQRGLDRFQRDLLLRLRRRQIGLAWFRGRLVHECNDASDGTVLTQEEWEDFLKDEEGGACARERLFQMRLVLANLYREAKYC